MEAVILDASPLVAYFDADEEHHAWCVRQFESLQPPLLSCEAAIAEAVYLVESRGGESARIFEFLQGGIIQIPFRLEKEIQTVITLRRRYANVPMSLADACLLRLSETHANSRVFTLDRDFKIYRRHGRQVIPLIFPAC
ncbi:MAG TPA: PIN domain-containing protein [Verrucomicrobiae bacterium]|jgi:predicted nucleic acid-binding protein